VNRKLLSSDAAWETAKAARRRLRHDDGVQEVVFLQRQFCSQWSERVPNSPVELTRILRALIHKKIAFVLTGAHGIGAWMGTPRNTQDVDILVRAGRSYDRAVKVITALYPHLQVRNFPGVSAFFLPGERSSVIDVIYPHRADLEDTLSNPTWIENKRLGLRYRIPSLEEALANKYGAMLTPTRAVDKRMLDAVDFTRMVQQAADEGQQPINLQRLATLGEHVWRSGGGREILRLVNQVRAGKAIRVDSLG
jgi:hypothetical protein